MSIQKQIQFVFFGTAPLAGAILDELEKRGLIPALIVAGADRYDIRAKMLIPPVEKKWANAHSVKVIQPQQTRDLIDELSAQQWDTFVVASYGKILPKAVLEIPRRGVVNMHPSLLPRLRGPSPIRSAILNDEKETGVSVIILDEQMDHGPILAQKKVDMPHTPMHGLELDELLACEGGALLAEYLPLWVAAEIEAREQNHDLATYCKMFKKEDGLIDLSADAYQNLLKIRAFEGWPGTFAFFEKDGPSNTSGQGKRIRVKILDAHVEKERLVLDRVIPEGKREMSFEEFSRGL